MQQVSYGQSSKQKNKWEPSLERKDRRLRLAGVTEVFGVVAEEQAADDAARRVGGGET